MRVLTLLDDGAKDSERDVVRRYWGRVIPTLQDAETEVVTATLGGPGPLHEELEARGYRAVALNARAYAQAPLASARIARLVRRDAIDLIHAHEVIPAALTGATRVMMPRRVLVFHRWHGYTAGKHALVSRLAARLSDFTLACSHAVAAYAQNLDGTSPARIGVAHGGIAQPRIPAPEERAALRHRLGIPDATKVVVVVARLRAEKGHRTLIRAMEHLAAEFSPAPHLVIVGTGPQEDELRAFADARPSLDVHFVGHQSDVSLWHALADVVAMPSDLEPFGLAAVEAMASRKPLVASAVDGLTEIVEDGLSGILVPPGNPHLFAAGLRRVLDDPKLARSVGDAAYERFRDHFTLDAMTARWKRCYERILT